MHSIRRGLAATVLAGFGVVTAASADVPSPRREPEPVRVRVSGASDCVRADVFFREIRARTPWVRKAEAGEVARTIVVGASATGRDVVGSLSFEEGARETAPRIVRAATCAEAVSAMALIAALSVDPSALTTLPLSAAGMPIADGGTADANRGDASPGGTDGVDAALTRVDPSVAVANAATVDAATPPPLAANVPTVEQAAPLPPRRAPRDKASSVPEGRWALTGGIGGKALLLSGSQGGIAFAPSVFLDASRSAPGFFAPSVRLSGERVAGATVGTTYGTASPLWLTLDLAVCPLHGLGGAVSACADLEGGQLRVRGQLRVSASGVETRSRFRPWFALGVLGRLAAPAFRITTHASLVLDVSLGLRAPLLRDTFQFLENPNEYVVYSAPAVVAHGDLDVGVRFW